MLWIDPEIIRDKYTFDEKGKVIPIPGCELTEEEQKALDKFSKELEEAYNDRFVDLTTPEGQKKWAALFDE